MAANPILNPSELNAHLNLLRAFHDLKSQVEDGTGSEFNPNTNPEERWESFVQVSVERYVVHESPSRETPTSRRCRFYRWVSSLKVDDTDIVVNMECPSLDVCLVWHAFMLNPRLAQDPCCAKQTWIDAYYSRYAEGIDKLDTLKSLGGLKPSLLDLFAGHHLGGGTSPWEPKNGVPPEAVTPFTTGPAEGGNYTFPIDLAAAVCAPSVNTRRSY